MNSFNQLKESLSSEDVDQLVELIACKSGKDEHLKRVLISPDLVKNIPVKPILDRLFKDQGEWKFFGIIDFRSEIKMVRKILMEVKNG